MLCQMPFRWSECVRTTIVADAESDNYSKANLTQQHANSGSFADSQGNTGSIRDGLVPQAAKHVLQACLAFKAANFGFAVTSSS